MNHIHPPISNVRIWVGLTCLKHTYTVLFFRLFIPNGWPPLLSIFTTVFICSKNLNQPSTLVTATLLELGQRPMMPQMVCGSISWMRRSRIAFPYCSMKASQESLTEDGKKLQTFSRTAMISSWIYKDQYHHIDYYITTTIISSPMSP